MRVLLIEDDRSTAQSIELMLKAESFNVYATDLGGECFDLGKLYDYDNIPARPEPAGHVGIPVAALDAKDPLKTAEVRVRHHRSSARQTIY